MDLLILTSALDRSAAAITSAADVTPLDGPDDFPQLVIGTTEPITVKHLSAASAYEEWSDDPDYTVSVALGTLTATGLDVYASAALSDVITDGKSGSLALTTSALANALAARLGWACRPRAFILTLQVAVTDPEGNRRVYAQLPVALKGTVSAFAQT